MNKIKQQTGLVRFSVLPENFQLEAHFFDDGRVESNRMGANRETDLAGSRLANYMHTLGVELSACLRRAYGLTPNEVLILSEVGLNGEMLVWVRSTRPVGREYLPSSKKRGTLELVEGDIEVVSTPSPSPSARPLLGRARVAELMRRSKLPVPRPDSSVVDLP